MKSSVILTAFLRLKCLSFEIYCFVINVNRVKLYRCPRMDSFNRVLKL